MSSKKTENDHKTNRKVKSIATSINIKQTACLLGEFIAMDLTILLLLVGSLVYCVEVHYCSAFQKFIKRSLAVETGRIYYIIGDKLEPLAKIEITLWLHVFVVAFCILLLVEILHVISQFRKGAKRIDKSLEPVYEMARQAQKLSEIDFDEKKYQDLEAAITKLKVEKNDAHIHMYNEELNSLEQAINGLIDRMRDAYRMQTRFVSDASHELRTPIAVVQGYVNLLDRWGKDDPVILAEAIEAIKQESMHMQTLVEQLLFLARGDSNRQKLEKVTVNLNDILKEIYEESLMIDDKHQYQLIEKGTGTLIGDPAMLKQSARILVDNACKYTPEGEEIILRVGEQQGNAFYEIEDRGIGMKQSNLEHIFERFYRADEVRNSKTGGTGLGLSIAKWIVDQHKGYYQVVSYDQIGTRFTVIFEEPLRADA